MTLGLRASSGWTCLYGIDVCTPWGSGSLPSRRASSVGVGETMGLSSADLSKEASRMSSSSSHMRGTRHLCRSGTAVHIVLGVVLNCSAQHCRALVSTTDCSFLTSWMSLVPWNQRGWGIPLACFVILGCWQPDTCSLLFCQLLYLDITELPWTQGLELQPPAWGLTFLS